MFKLRYKLFFTFLLFSCAIVATMYGFTRFSVDTEFDEFIQEEELKRLEKLIPTVKKIYQENGNSWNFVNQQYLNLLETLEDTYIDIVDSELDLADKNLPSDFDDQEETELRTESLNPQIYDIVLLDASKTAIIGELEESGDIKLTPIYNDDRTIGWIGFQTIPEMDEEALAYLEELNRSLLLILLLMIALSGVVSWLLASHLEKPIAVLIQGAKELRSGNYHHRIPTTSNDELGKLSEDFNSLASSLESNENIRKQWTADISHELRTPLTLLSGEFQAVQDGIRELTPNTVHRLNKDVNRLTRLVDDLHDLSLSDEGALTYRKKAVHLLDVIHQSIDFFEKELTDQQLTLDFNPLGYESCKVMADEDRLLQLIMNLLRNSIQYTHPGGAIRISLNYEESHIVITVEDSAPGVSEKIIPKLFDRLFRVEQSRNTKSGGSGLGLSICKNIVKAHDGTIEACPSALKGLKVTIKLPKL